MFLNWIFQCENGRNFYTEEHSCLMEFSEFTLFSHVYNILRYPMFWISFTTICLIWISYTWNMKYVFLMHLTFFIYSCTFYSFMIFLKVKICSSDEQVYLYNPVSDVFGTVSVKCWGQLSISGKAELGPKYFVIKPSKSNSWLTDGVCIKTVSITVLLINNIRTVGMFATLRGFLKQAVWQQHR